MLWKYRLAYNYTRYFSILLYIMPPIFCLKPSRRSKAHRWLMIHDYLALRFLIQCDGRIRLI